MPQLLTAAARKDVEHRYGRLTLADLAKELRLSESTTNRIVNEPEHKYKPNVILAVAKWRQRRGLIAKPNGNGRTAVDAMAHTPPGASTTPILDSFLQASNPESAADYVRRHAASTTDHALITDERITVTVNGLDISGPPADVAALARELAK